MCVCSRVPAVFTDYLAQVVGASMLAERRVFEGLSRFIKLAFHFPGFDLSVDCDDNYWTHQSC